MIAIPVLRIGGTEIQTLSLVSVLVGAGYNVKVCCYYEYDDSMVDRFEAAGAGVLLLKYKRSEGLWRLAKGLIRIFREVRPDIVHVQYIAPGLVPVMAANFAGVRTVFATIHIAGEIAYGLKAKAFLSLAASLCTAFFCVSKNVEEFWFGSSEVFDSENVTTNRRHYTIYNSVDSVRIVDIAGTTNRDGLRAEIGIGKNRLIGIVGRLAPQKGHAILLDALEEVVRIFPDVMVLVIGTGPEEPSLRQKALMLGLKDHIRWLGETRQDKVFQSYSIMNLLVMPSLYEGFGLAAAEAMAAGLPVIGTRVDGLSEIIEDNVTGYLVPAENVPELARAIVKLISDAGLMRQMGLAGQKRITELFSGERFGESWLGAYRTLAGN